jgi:hypothetical protein
MTINLDDSELLSLVNERNNNIVAIANKVEALADRMAIVNGLSQQITSPDMDVWIKNKHISREEALKLLKSEGKEISRLQSDLSQVLEPFKSLTDLIEKSNIQ